MAFDDPERKPLEKTNYFLEELQMGRFEPHTLPELSSSTLG